ncbi:MAG TPA: ABC transporter permease [Alphaproteobacteria bacterium]|nr:ABC transporter permease [Alphaproteobacteria bacterium]
MKLLRRMWNTLRLRGLNRELDEELRLHMDLRAEDFERNGLTPAAARSAAARQFGNMTLEKERMRTMDIAAWLETTWKDIRFGVRQFVRNPVFTAVAVVSLAVGVGANTAIFSVFNGALLKALPVRDPQSLVILTDPNSNGTWMGMSTGVRQILSYAEFTQLRDHTTTMSGMSAVESGLSRWQIRVGSNASEDALGQLVSEEYFTLFGLEPAIGRFFTAQDATGLGKDPYVVISYDYWQKRFGGSTSVLGTPIRLYQATVTVIGVGPRGFHGENAAASADLWVPMMMQLQVMPGRDWLHEDLSQSLQKVMWLHVFGRLKPGVPVAKAQSEIDVLFKGIIESGYPTTLSPETRKEAMDQHIKVQEARTGVFGGREEFSKQMLVLLSVAGVVLLIACANVANLLLARATARLKEVGVRLSIGASRGRLIRQFLTESLLLSAIGGVTGLAVAVGASRALVFLLSTPRNPLQVSTSLDWRVLSFTAVTTLLTGLLFGLVPAIRGTRVNINSSLRDSGRGVTQSGGRLNLAKMLVVAQVALSLVLVVGAGLFLRTLFNLQAAGLGYPKESLVLVRANPLTAGYKEAQLLGVYHSLADRLRTLPGVRGVTYSENGLFAGTESGSRIEVDGFTPQNDRDRNARYDQVGAGYFSTVGIPFMLGREIGIQDTAASPKVCVINEAFAKKFFAGRNPVGHHIVQMVGDKPVSIEVVGVAKDARDHGLRGDVPPRFYLAIDQATNEGIPQGAHFELRTAGNVESILAAIRKAILEVNEDIANRSTPVAELVDASTTQDRLIARLCSIFGIIALALAATGLYGVLSYGVARRTNEIGIRMALGAGQSRVVGMILRETGLMVSIGIVAGIIAAVASTRLIAARLYGLSALDPLTLAASVAILAAVAMIAGYIPANRAARVNPVSALRTD